MLSQSLLSPVLGTLTDAMGQRLQVAIFPTYVNPDVKSEKERTSGRVSPTLTVVTEFGVALTDKFDLSVLMAPNTTDVPPQGHRLLSADAERRLSPRPWMPMAPGRASCRCSSGSEPCLPRR